MQIYIKNNDSRPIYEQIVTQIRDQIANGSLVPGTLMPSIRHLAKELKVSVITTKRVYEELEREGLIRTVPGKGSYVAEQNKDFIQEKYLSEIQQKLEEALILAKTAAIDYKEVYEMLQILEEEIGE
ncbi:GntR family transcriptional regulator [Erysipelothrix sp. HDW6B]|uniref:GntR family transcriptional regulator n=1 Tax=Erysipelothrix TaxID=1647 RepID=UPI001356B5F3|nr:MULTISPECIES: GntR family transcriptional regulator [Erysipelothrix]QIK85132.1 GntR family transcriptional regulator [Erysipelothrix sp. HDW6B]